MGYERGKSRMVTKLLYRSITFVKVIHIYDIKFKKYITKHPFFTSSHQFASVKTSRYSSIEIHIQMNTYLSGVCILFSFGIL